MTSDSLAERASLRADRVPLGILFMLGATVMSAVSSALSKCEYWWTRALSLAPPSAVGPFYYFMLVWSAALGFIFWGDVPTFTLFAGSAIVVGSGLFLLWHETSRKPLPVD